MTDGTSQGLFIVVAIVIFGIFVALSYTVFGSDGLSGGISGLFEDSIELTVDNYRYRGITPTEQEDFIFTIDEVNRTAKIDKYIGTDVNVRIPDTFTVDGVDYTVTTIGVNSFYGANGINPEREPIAVALERIYFPDTITEIEGWAFAWNNLSHVEIPETLTVLSEGMFRGNNLTSVTIPESITEVERYVFGDNNLRSIVIPDGVTSIGDYAFRENRLTSVVFPDSLEHIGMYAFWHNRLSDIQLPENLVSISGHAFRHNNLTSLTLPDSVQSLGTRVFRENNLDTVSIKDYVTYVDSGTEATFDSNVTINID